MRIGRRISTRGLIAALSTALLIEIGAVQVAFAADGLGKPEPSKSRASAVREVKGLGADKARERRAKERKLNKEQAERAEREQAADPEPVEKRRPRSSSIAQLSVSSTEASGGGDYSATPLSASASWTAGGNAASFTWGYDITVPEPPAGPSPNLSLNYDSGSIDGRTSTTNNQGSALGEGFSITESYIERTYGSCDEDGHGNDQKDLCWKYDNARLVLNGKASRLVKDGSTWRLSNDDAAQVERHTGASNGDDNGEYWTVTTTDGTVYTFGKDNVGGSETDSVWTVPVYGDDSGEPGYSEGTSFNGRSLRQAWRWNLDMVEDTHGNAATYWYTKETNHYRKNGASTANTAYTRGGYLKEIRYGQRADALDTYFYRVKLSHKERCTAEDCSELTEDTKDNWPDVPFEALCTDGESETDCTALGPSYFSRKRLTGITTQVKDGDTFRDVDSWAFTQDYLDPGDIGGVDDQVLVLKKIQRTGKAGAKDDITLDPVKFTYRMLENRVDATDDILPITRPRLSTITTETGGLITVTYSAPECVRSEVIDAPEDTNTRSCYPQYWHINGASEASVDWFHKYRVLAVVTTDPTGLGETMETSYKYKGAAWHYSDSPFTPKDERTWSDWRGYRKVTTYTGAVGTTRSKSVSIYMQGMDGDKTETGTRDVTLAGVDVAGLDVPNIADSDQFSGRLRQQITYNGDTPVTVKVTDPWSKETARQDVPGAGDHVARYVRDEKTTTHTYLTADQTWRSRAVTTTYDDYGMPTRAGDTGEIGKGGDETCTRTWYARNPDAGITSLVSRELTVARGCGTALADVDMPADTSRRGEVLSDTATVYDNPDATTWNTDQTPTKGEVTWTGRATGYTTTGSPASWQTATTSGYDALGRVTSTTDAKGNASTTAYTPSGAGPLERTVATNPAGHNLVAFYEPLRGQALRSYDVNRKLTEKAFDALGRLTDVWLPNRGTSQPASYTFSYHLHNDKPSYVSSGRIAADGDTHITTYTIYDSLLRKLQTQTPSPHGGRILTDTRYNSRGLANETYADIFDPTTEPGGTYTRALHGEAPKQTVTTYDGVGRATSSTLLVFGTEKWSTTTTYTGDSTATTARNGGEATRTITDIRGNTIERRTYAGSQPSDPDFGGTAPGIPYNTTKFTFTLDGKDKTVTGPDGTQWTYTYDLFGRQVKNTDPDKGTSTAVYNSLDQVIKATDSRGQSILTEYDALGRVTSTWANEKTDANRLTAFTYDTVLKGKPTTSTRYQEGAAYTTEVLAYDTLGHRQEWELQLPATDPLVEAGAPSTYAFDAHYSIDGLLRSKMLPAMGGLQQEAVSYTYTLQGMLKEIGGSTGYLLDADYTPTGLPDVLTLGTGGTGNNASYVDNTYQQGTDRLLSSEVSTDTHGWMLQATNYTYDPAGNVTSITDPTTLGGQQAADTQCFDYDGHRRLTDAWTPASGDCTDARDTDALGGRAPYWTSYTYNDAGQRTSETDHTTADKDTYCYTGNQPHTLTGISTTADCTNPDRDYAYDPAGNTTERPGQTLAWNTEGKLAKVTEGVVDTNYLYDASGNLLIRQTEGGERVLYAGDTELHLRADGTMWAQRYYGTQDMTIAVRSNRDTSSGTKLSYLATDKHRTSTLAIDAGDEQTFVKRALAPFGQRRTEARIGDWVDDKAFIGKTHDEATGLTHIGAREYDPTTGTFLSVDPLLETDKPQTLNGYSYGAQNPYTYTDPTGTELACDSKPGGMPPCPEHGAIDSSGRTGSGGMLSVTSRPVGNGHINTGTVRDRFGDIVRVTKHYREYTKPVGDGGKAQKKKAEEDSILESIWDSTGGKVVSAIADGAEATWEGLKTAGRWVGDHWRGMLETGVFAVCVIASAGACVVASVIYLGAKHVTAYANGKFSGGKLARDVIWTAIGGSVGRAVAGSWRTTAIVRRGRKIKYVGPSGSTYGYTKRIEKGGTYANMSVNTAISGSTCGAGSASIGNAPLVGVC